MLTYNEVIELKEKLASGLIDLELAQENYWNDFKEGQRSWETKDWKERRLKVIKDKCEICSSTDTLTMQHRSHPRKYAEHLREVTRRYTDEYSNTNPQIDKSELSEYVLKRYNYIPIPLCPHCKTTLVARIHKVPKYRCPKCRHEFDETVIKSVNELIEIFYENEETIEGRDKCFVSNDQYKNKHSLSDIKYWLKRECAKNKDARKIETEAFLNYLSDCIKYLSFEDAFTACKKCAYGDDIHKMDLCPKCKTNYKGLQYTTCIDCLPEDKRKAALESIAFGKEWQQMHKDLGIE